MAKCCACDREARFPPWAPVHCCSRCYDRAEQVANPEHTETCDVFADVCPSCGCKAGSCPPTIECHSRHQEEED